MNTRTGLVCIEVLFSMFVPSLADLRELSSSMTFRLVTVSAPSKVILHGEHAVVYGKTAVAAALDLRTSMTLKPHSELVVVKFPDLGISQTWTLDKLR